MGDEYNRRPGGNRLGVPQKRSFDSKQGQRERPQGGFGGNQDKQKGRKTFGRAPQRGARTGKVFVKTSQHPGIFIAHGGREDMLVTKSLYPGESVYGEKRIKIEDKDKEKTEYRVWNPYRSKIAAGILNDAENIYIKPGSRVLYLGAASGTTVSHVADVVGEEGVVYAVEFSPRSGRDLVTMAKKRTNIVPIVEDARYPHRYRMLVGTVDVVFSDVAQPDQVRIVALNAQHFLKTGGHVLVSIKASCVDSTAEPTAVFAQEVAAMRDELMKPQEQILLDPYEKDHALVIAVYRADKKKHKNK